MKGCGGCFGRRFPPECAVKGCNSAHRVKRGLKTTPPVGQGAAGRATAKKISTHATALLPWKHGAAAAAADFRTSSTPARYCTGFY